MLIKLNIFFFWSGLFGPPRGPQGVRGSALGASDFACPTVPDIPVQQPEQRGSSPSLRNPEHVATTEPMCSTTIRPTDCGAWQQKKTWWRPLRLRYYGMCGIKQPEEDAGKPKIIKETEINEVHGESWSSRLSVRASSQPSPSLNGGSDGYSLRFLPAGCVSTPITQPFVCAAPTGNPLITWISYGSVFCRVAGNISWNGRAGLRSEYNSRGCEGQRSILAARTTAPPQTLSLFSLWMCFSLSYHQLCVL